MGFYGDGKILMENLIQIIKNEIQAKIIIGKFYTFPQPLENQINQTQY
jgi:hypothetical protein